ncbi:MAG TPA: hypothetical protein VKG61_04125 [Streptosporangiaceae bacterium]|nr:hypothetical protein [Streptosporangiaceae bacterium]HME64067.1 hypothetical protein [Streptosporangiaceae bacterium]
MFDRLAWRRECYERYLLLDDEADELDDTEEAAYWADAEDPSRIDGDTSLISPDAAVTAEVMTSVTPRTGAAALGQRQASA